MNRRSRSSNSSHGPTGITGCRGSNECCSFFSQTIKARKEYAWKGEEELQRTRRRRNDSESLRGKKNQSALAGHDVQVSESVYGIIAGELAIQGIHLHNPATILQKDITLKVIEADLWRIWLRYDWRLNTWAATKTSIRWKCIWRCEFCHGRLTIEHNDLQQGSQAASNDEPQQRPQYDGSGLGDASFVEDDDDSEFLLDEALAREGLYWRMSSILSLTILSKLIWTRQLQKSVAFLQSGTVDYITFLHLFRPGS